jgi:hypothetical protein
MPQTDQERLDEVERESSARLAALCFARIAIEDAIDPEIGLDAEHGRRVLAIIDEAVREGTFDEDRYGPPPEPD